MNLKDYIRQSYLRPNPMVLESLGANKKLIDYLCFTPWNTNIHLIDSMIEEDEDFQLLQFNTIPDPLGQSEVRLCASKADVEAVLNYNLPSGKVIYAEMDGYYKSSSEETTTQIPRVTAIIGDQFSSMDNLHARIIHLINFNLNYQFMFGQGNVPTVSEDYYIFMDEVDSGQINVYYKIVDGYKINFSEIISGVAQTAKYYIRKGDSFTNTDMYPITDGTNTYQPGESFIPTSDMNMTVVKTVYRTVSFDANGGSNPPQSRSVVDGGVLEYSNYEWTMSPPSDDKEFDCWTTEKDNPNTKVFRNHEDLVVTSDITLYAYWKDAEIGS